MDHAPIERLERALAAAARRFVHGLRAAERERLQHHELAAVLSRLGFSGEEIETLAAGAAPGVLITNARTRLSCELERLGRQARGQRLGYDLNRHIAVRRALAQLDGRGDFWPNPLRDERLPGHVVNRRFAGQSRKRREAKPALTPALPAPS